LTSHHFSNWLGLANFDCTKDTNTYLVYGIGNKPMNRIKQNTESIINDAACPPLGKKNVNTLWITDGFISIQEYQIRHFILQSWKQAKSMKKSRENTVHNIKR
jgi:hypothetical protein